MDTATKYLGIYKQYDDGQWFLYECRYGTSQAYDHEPTAAEIDTYRNHLVRLPEFA